MPGHLRTCKKIFMETIIAQDEPRIASVLIEVPVLTVGATRINFPDVQQLRNTINQVIIIKTIRLITPKVLANGILNAAANMSRANIINAAAVIYCEGWEKGKFIPLSVLNDVYDMDSALGTTIPFKNSAPNFSNWVNVDWAQSYVQFANGQSATATGVFIFDVQYLKAKAQAFANGTIEEIVGPS